MMDVCRSDNGDMTTNLNDQAVNCTNNEDHVWLYLSTGVTATTGGSGGTSGGDGLVRPTGNVTSGGFNLATALTVNGNKTGVLVVDATNKIGDSGAACDMEPPLFSFSTK